MKTIKQYITEKLVIKKKSNQYKYFPETKKELKAIIKQRIKDEGNEVDLNDIDVSNITDMYDLFANLDFNGNISTWDVSNVKDMSGMFFGCELFNQDISKWYVSNVINMYNMFNGCVKFNQDISSWNVSNVKDKDDMFHSCPIKEKYKPNFK